LDREIEHARTLQPYSARHKWSRPSWLLQCLVLTRRRYREKYNNIPKTIGPFIILGFIGFILSSYVCAIFKRLPAYSDTHQFSLSLSLSLSLSCDRIDSILVSDQIFVTFCICSRRRTSAYVSRTRRTAIRHATVLYQFATRTHTVQLDRTSDMGDVCLLEHGLEFGGRSVLCILDARDCRWSRDDELCAIGRFDRACA